MPQQNEKTIQELKLEVQELRQCLIQIILAQRNSALSEQFCDHWWEKLTEYPPVEVNEKAMDCCEGGPQYGHAWSCPTLP